ncbi:MAG: glycosyltransferase family 2 protein [Chitinophagales bacterium]
MQFVIFFFWVSLTILFFCYIGYGILLFLFNKIKLFFTRYKKDNELEELVPVTLVVAVYNEAAILEAKIKNTFNIDYPAEKLQVIFVDDGSSDNSSRIIKQYPSIKLLQQPERKGKPAAIKKAMQIVQTPVVIFSDANAMLNEKCIRKMVPHYANQKIGGVAGEKRIFRNQHVSAVGEAEGFYWQYESFMKKQDADFNTVVGAAGELYSIRAALFTELDDDLILDDFITSMQVCLKGYRIKYEPGAYSTETPSASLAEEEKRKTRISAGAYQSIGYLKKAMNIFKYPMLAFQYISRRFLRWTFCPLMLIILLMTNIFIMNSHSQNNFYSWFMYAQILFYGLALLGWLFVRMGWRTGIMNIPFYFVFMNYCLVNGFITFLRGQQTVLWKKSVRETIQAIPD